MSLTSNVVTLKKIIWQKQISCKDFRAHLKIKGGLKGLDAKHPSEFSDSKEELL